jgi:hypothetical protein
MHDAAAEIWSLFDLATGKQTYLPKIGVYNTTADGQQQAGMQQLDSRHRMVYRSE